MKGFLGMLLALALMVAGNASAEVLRPHYLLDVEARFTVSADGTVEGLEVRGLDDEMILGRLVERLDKWTFSMDERKDVTPGPVEPVGVTARFQLVAESDGESMQIRIRRPSFSTRPLGARPHADDWKVDGQTVHRAAIRHPVAARRASSAHFLDTDIVFQVDYGPDGRVLQTGVASIDLFDVEVRESERGTMERMLQPYVDEGRRGLRRWRFPEASGEDPPAVRSLLVPIRFSTVGGRGARRGEWRHALSADSLVDEWARRRGDQRAVAGLDDASDELDQRLVLLATEDELIL